MGYVIREWVNGREWQCTYQWDMEDEGDIWNRRYLDVWVGLMSANGYKNISGLGAKVGEKSLFR